MYLALTVTAEVGCADVYEFGLYRVGTSRAAITGEKSLHNVGAILLISGELKDGEIRGFN